MIELSIDKKYLLDIKETMVYTGWGETSIRNLLNSPLSTFTVKKGNRLYTNRKLLEEYIDKMTKDSETIAI